MLEGHGGWGKSGAADRQRTVLVGVDGGGAVGFGRRGGWVWHFIGKGGRDEHEGRPVDDFNMRKGEIGDDAVSSAAAGEVARAQARGWRGAGNAGQVEGGSGAAELRARRVEAARQLGEANPAAAQWN